jgi:replicative DNA helicase
MQERATLLSPEPQPLANSALEQSLLGTLLVRPDKISDLPPGFAPEHYAFEHHPQIHRAILAVAQSGTPSSFAVMNALRGEGIEPAYIAGLMNCMVGPNGVKTQAETITDLWRRREMVRVAKELTDRAYESGREMPAAAILTEAMGELDALASTAINRQTMFGIDEAAQAAVEAAQRAAAGVVTGIGTGFASIDHAIGSLEPGALYVLAGRPGMGKTALAVQIALNMALAGRRVLYDSLEMQASQIGRRALSFMAHVPLHALKHGRWNAHDAESIVAAQRRLTGVPLMIDQQSGVNTAMVALKARSAKRTLGGLDAIFVDHMHIIATDAQAERNGAARAVEKVSNDLKRLGGDMGVPVIALAQLSRGVEGREDKRPGMADLRQSGAIEQDAEAIMLLYRGEYYLPKSEPEQGPTQSEGAYSKAVAEWRDAKERLAGKAEIIIPKNRDGEPCTVTMKFDGPRTAFEDAQ